MQKTSAEIPKHTQPPENLSFSLKSMALRLKNSTAIRITAWPIVNAIRYYRLYTYQWSSDAKKLRELKDKYRGERCFIIGNGPSLTASDLDKLKGEHCFAANRIFEIFPYTQWRPEFYLCVDQNVLDDSLQQVSHIDSDYVFIHMEGKKCRIDKECPRIIYVNNFYPFYVKRYKYIKNIIPSNDISHHLSGGETVSFDSIQMAVYMGFTQIYLLGVDHDYSRKQYSDGTFVYDPDIKDYFGNIESKPYNIQNIETGTKAYESALEYAEKNGIEILNATRGGRLEVFPRVSFNDIVKAGEPT